MRLKSLSLVIVLTIGMQSQSCAHAAGDDVETLSNEIVTKELKLLRLGIEVKRNIESKRLWRERRFSMYALANSTLTCIGAFMTGAGRLHYANEPKKAPNSLFENATILRVVANSVSVGGVLVEFSLDAVGARKDRKRKLDRACIMRQAEKLNAEIRNLLKERAAAISSGSREKLSDLYDDEGRLLADLHEAVIDELAAFQAEARGKKARRLAQLTLTGASNFASGAGSLYSGIIVPHNFKHAPLERIRRGGVSGITDIITGSTNIATPLLATAAEAWQRRDLDAVLLKQLGAADVLDLYRLEQEQRQLQSKYSDLNDTPASLPARQEAIATAISVFHKHQEINQQEHKHALMKLLMSVADSGVDSSGSFGKVTNGIGTAVGAYRYTRDAHKRFLVTGNAAIAYGVGNAIGVEEVLRDGITREVKHTRQKNQHQLISQVLDDELSSLEAAENAIGLHLH